MERSYYALSLDYEMHWHCGDNVHIWSSYLSDSFVMRCFSIARTIPTSSSSWSTDQTFDLGLWLLLLRRTLTFFDNFDRRLRTMRPWPTLRLERLWFTLWISYYGGRKTSAIQLYLADLHWQCRTEHSILHWGLKLWDAISMWKADLEKERCVLTTFCIQKKVVQIPCVNHFVLEKLAANGQR